MHVSTVTTVRCVLIRALLALVSKVRRHIVFVNYLFIYLFLVDGLTLNQRRTPSRGTGTLAPAPLPREPFYYFLKIVVVQYWVANLNLTFRGYISKESRW